MRGKNLIIPGLGVLLLILFLILPPLAPLTPMGMKAIGVFLFTITWWATVSTGYPSLIAIGLLIATGVMSYKDAFAASYGWWITLFLLGTNGLSEALNVTGYSRRFALWFISRPFVAGHPWRLVAMFLLACTMVGAVLTGAATTLIFIAIAVPMLEALGYKKGDAFAATFMMGIAWAATASLSITPIGHVGNILAIEWIKRDFGYNISFMHWMAYGIPMGILTLGLLLAIFRFVVKPDTRRITELSGDYIKGEIQKMGPMKTEEKIALAVFLTVAVIWLLPSLVGSFLPAVGQYVERISMAVPAILGACLLCIIPVKGKPVLTFKRWMRDGVEWDAFNLVAAIGIISAVLENPATGIAAFFTALSQPVANALPAWGFLAFALFWVVIITNAMSNTVAFTLVYVVMIPVTLAVGNLYGPAFAMSLICASNYAFALPSATPSTALVTGSGWVPIPFMAKYGLPLIPLVVILFMVVGYPLASWIFG